MAGLVLVIVRARRDPVVQTLRTKLPWLAYLAVTTLAVVGFIPVDWERYYLPLEAPWSVAMAAALWAVPAWVWTRFRKKGEAAS